jgi:cysteinyl-tRNA synthetase
MSRSVGNVILISTLEAMGIDPLAYRYLLLTAHYRTKLNFTDESLQAAQNGLNNLRSDLAELLAHADTTVSLTTWSADAAQTHEAFHTAINDDLDLPTALSITRELARNHKIAPAERYRLLLDFDRVLGLSLDKVEARGPREISAEARELVRQRDEARAARNWKMSDQLRSQLQELGFEVRDTPKGTELV